MEREAGLDASLKEISICVVDRNGKTIARGTCPAGLEGMASRFRARSLTPRPDLAREWPAFNVVTARADASGVARHRHRCASGTQSPFGAPRKI